MIFSSPVYPIPPSYKDGELELGTTDKYIKYLSKKGVKNIMSTAGTSQFNLLDKNEVRLFNETLLDSFDGNVILGIPQLSLKHTLEEINKFNSRDLKNVYFLVLFPERYYNDDQIVDFFEEVCSGSEYPILVHGNSIKKGNGGVYEYDYQLLSRLSKIDGFIGIKEESSTLDYSLKNINGLDMEIIVAGGSMRRFWSLEPFGATTYLAGVGSFNPEIEERFYQSYMEGDLISAKKIIREIETPLFKEFMTIGWHASMRESLRIMGYINNNREPFYCVSEEEKNSIKKALNKIL